MTRSTPASTPTSGDPEALLTVAQACALSGLSPSSLYRRERRGTLRSVRDGRHHRKLYRRADIEALGRGERAAQGDSARQDALARRVIERLDAGASTLAVMRELELGPDALTSIVDRYELARAAAARVGGALIISAEARQKIEALAGAPVRSDAELLEMLSVLVGHLHEAVKAGFLKPPEG